MIKVGSKFRVKSEHYDLTGHGNIMVCTKILPNGNICCDLCRQTENFGYWVGYVELVNKENPVADQKVFAP